MSDTVYIPVLFFELSKKAPEGRRSLARGASPWYRKSDAQSRRGDVGSRVWETNCIFAIVNPYPAARNPFHVLPRPSGAFHLLTPFQGLAPLAKLRRPYRGLRDDCVVQIWKKFRIDLTV